MLTIRQVPWEKAKLVVPVEPTPWPANKGERISVNSYGIGGSNAHVSLVEKGFQIEDANFQIVRDRFGGIARLARITSQN